MARSIVPCLDSLEGERRGDAIAIIRGVAAELPAPGSRRTKSMSRNGTAVTFTDVGSAFTADDRSALRALCGTSTVPGLPVGSFPKGRPFGRVWPEDERS